MVPATQASPTHIVPPLSRGKQLWNVVRNATQRALLAIITTVALTALGSAAVWTAAGIAGGLILTSIAIHLASKAPSVNKLQRRAYDAYADHPSLRFVGMGIALISGHFYPLIGAILGTAAGISSSLAHTALNCRQRQQRRRKTEMELD